MYIEPPSLAALHLSNVLSVMLARLPDTNIAPPKTSVRSPLSLITELMVKDDFVIVALSPVRQIVPPLELEVPLLIPVLL